MMMMMMIEPTREESGVQDVTQADASSAHSALGEDLIQPGLQRLPTGKTRPYLERCEGFKASADSPKPSLFLVSGQMDRTVPDDFWLGCFPAPILCFATWPPLLGCPGQGDSRSLGKVATKAQQA